MTVGGAGRRAMRYGCLGCLGLLALAVAAVAIAFGVAAVKARTEVVERGTRTPDAPLAGSRERGPERDAPERTDGAAVPGRVELVLSHAEFRVEPAAPGDPLTVDATYDRNSYSLDEGFRDDPGGGRTYRVSFRRDGPAFLAAIAELLGGTRPEVVIRLPRDVPLDVEMRIGSGGAVVELGGTWVTALDVEVNRGGFVLDFGEPLREPMKRLGLRGRMGGLVVGAAGNASPETMAVDFGMGGLDLDLGGRWVRDARIGLRLRMGGAQVRLPRDVVVRGIEGGDWGVREPPEIGPPVLTFDVHADMGEFEFSD